MTQRSKLSGFFKTTIRLPQQKLFWGATWRAIALGACFGCLSAWGEESAIPLAVGVPSPAPARPESVENSSSVASVDSPAPTSVLEQPLTESPPAESTANPAENSVAPGRRLSGILELLALRGIDESKLQALVDGRPLDPDEDEVVAHLMYVIAKIPTEKIQQWAHKDVNWEQLALTPANYRGDVFQVRGHVRRIEQVAILPELAQRFEYDHLLRMEFKLDDSDLPAIVLARSIPKAWRIDERMDERASFFGLFLKHGDSLVFAADRIAWHPERVDPELGVRPDHLLLGDLGLDVGLLENVLKSKSLGPDRECFYQLLWAVGKADPQKLVERTAGNYDFPPLLQTSDGRPPIDQPGRLLALEGTARRCVKILVDDRDIRERFGIDHYYEIDMFVRLDQNVQILRSAEDKQGAVFTNYPVIFCVRELPPGMPEGDEINEWVRIPAFYFKLWAYQSKFMSNFDADQVQISPMLVGRIPTLIHVDTSLPQWLGIAYGGVFVVGLGVIWFFVWRYSRSDRQFKIQTLDRQLHPEPEKSLDEMGIKGQDGPDFSGLS